MSGASIPAEAVEEAARVLVQVQSDREYYPEGDPSRDDLDRYAEAHAKAVLEAAAPHLMNLAWHEGYGAGKSDSPFISPYSKARVPTELEQAEIDAFQNGVYGAEPPEWWINRGANPNE